MSEMLKSEQFDIPCIWEGCDWPSFPLGLYFAGKVKLTNGDFVLDQNEVIDVAFDMPLGKEARKLLRTNGTWTMEKFLKEVLSLYKQMSDIVAPNALNGIYIEGIEKNLYRDNEGLHQVYLIQYGT